MRLSVRKLACSVSALTSVISADEMQPAIGLGLARQSGSMPARKLSIRLVLTAE